VSLDKYLDLIRAINENLYLMAIGDYNAFYNLTYADRKDIFTDMPELEHSEKELLAQERALLQDNQNAIGSTSFNNKMMHQVIARGREGFIKYLKSKIEDLSYPEVPPISKVISGNYRIESRLIDAYYRLVPQPREREEVSKHYSGQLHRYNPPYSLCVYGAMVLSMDWEWLQLNRKEKDNPYDKVTDEEVEAALRNYGNGFKKGYFNFEHDMLNEPSATIVMKNDFCAKKVFNYVFNSYPGRGGYPITVGNGNQYFETWYETGIEAGRYYRAWYIMIEYIDVFENIISNTYPVTNKTTRLEGNNVNNRVSFKPELLPQIFAILKDFFEPKRHNDLMVLLEDGKLNGTPLIFNDSGNRIADAFKQLINSDLCIGSNKKGLEKWIFSNFHYKHRGQEKQFTLRYLNDIISTNKDKCRKPLMNVKLSKATGNYLIEKT
jgi:hypothetical protein